MVTRKRVDVGFYLIFACQICLLITQWVILINYPYHYDDPFYGELTIETIYGVEDCIIGLIHLVLGILIERRLRNNFPQFNAKYKLYLNLITIILSLPLLLRGTIDILDAHSDDFDDWFYTDNDIWTSPLFFLVCDYIPLTSNLSALIFGVIRYKDKIFSSSEKNLVTSALGESDSSNNSLIKQTTINSESFFDPPNFELYEDSFYEEQQK